MQRASIFLLAVFLLGGCHGPAPCSWGPPDWSADAEALAGARAAPAVEARYGGVVRDAQAEQRMRRIGLRLAQCTSEIRGEYQCRLLDVDRLNAVSLPGGRVYVTRGLYERLKSDDQMAAVLAHEIAHIVSKDHFKPRCSCSAEAIEREIAADALGAEYLRNAGIDPQAMIDVVRLIADAQPKGWSDTRIRALLCQTSQADKASTSAQH